MENEGMQTASKADAVSEHAQTTEPEQVANEGITNEEHEPTHEELMALLDSDDEEAPENEQTPQAEPKPEPPKEEPKEDPLSQKFAELSKMESKYQKQIRELKDKIDGFEEGSKGKLSKDELLEELRRDYKKNPKRFLEKQLGGSYDELSDFILHEEDRSKEIEANEKLSATEQRIEKLEKMLEEKEKGEKESKYNEKIESFKNNIRNFTKQKGEDYGIVSELDEVDTVYEVMQNYFEEHGKTLDIDEACSQVESFYLEKLKGLSKLEKVKKMFNVDNSNEVKKPRDPSPPREESDTLTNDLTSGYSDSDLENMSDEERERMALDLL